MKLRKKMPIQNTGFFSSLLERIFILSVVICLSITSAAKVMSAMGYEKVLSLEDPIVGLSNRSLFWLVAAIEASIAALLLWPKASNMARHLAIGWFGAAVLLYRGWVGYINPRKPCPCLGNMTAMLGIDSNIASKVMACLAVYILTGSILFCIYNLRKNSTNLLSR